MLKINKTSEHANNAYFIFLFLHRIANTRMHEAIAINNISYEFIMYDTQKPAPAKGQRNVKVFPINIVF